MGIRIDAHDRVSADGRARESLASGGGNHQLWRLFDNLTDAAFVETTGGRILEANKAACSMLGYARDEFVEMDVEDLIPREIAARLSAAIREETVGDGVCLESVSLRKNGERIPVEVSTTLVEIGGETHGIAIMRDITERKKAEADLTRYKERLEEMVRARTRKLERVNGKLTREINECKRMLGALGDSESHLKEQKTTLEKKNIELREVLEQIEIEKKQIRDDIAANVEELLLPGIQKLKRRAAKTETKYIDILQGNLEQIASSFGRKIAMRTHKLSPREIEICNLIRSGMSSKEIAETFTISLKTVENHRDNIRRKFKLVNKGTNLASYLKGS